MGRKARLKQLRREAISNPSPESASKADFDNTQFVDQLERQGYKLQEIQHSPSVPESNKSMPQL
ncbi:hypothetical protein ACE1CD_01695 [Aerosakkonema sp. BLCC-F183]|uniref:hypothetical protein n=1 Tax=Aerosakkonema sp. BLCC-F183 TaxID=3342834 RepID=UPI0035B7204A